MLYSTPFPANIISVPRIHPRIALFRFISHSLCDLNLHEILYLQYSPQLIDINVLLFNNFLNNTFLRVQLNYLT